MWKIVQEKNKERISQQDSIWSALTPANPNNIEHRVIKFVPYRY